MDTVFLDFVKVLGKVNYRILVDEVVKQNMKGKLEKVDQGVLTNGKFKVMAYGTIWESWLFIKNGISFSIVYKSWRVKRCFPDDIWVSKITGSKDKEKIQKKKIYKRAEENLMDFS